MRLREFAEPQLPDYIREFLPHVQKELKLNDYLYYICLYFFKLLYFNEYFSCDKINLLIINKSHKKSLGLSYFSKSKNNK